MGNSRESESANVRPAAHAGRFYPADPAELRRMVSGFLKCAHPCDEPAPKAIIAPHAGYLYSGPIAASAYARLEKARATVRRIVLLGPAHYEAFAGVATSEVDAFATPLGLVPLDSQVLARISALPHIRPREQAHQPEHCLEVHLPFLQTILDEFTLVPLLVGEATDEQISEMLEALWGGPETRIVVSSDLSHYHSHGEARTLDQATARAIEALRSDALDSEQACGCEPIRGLLRSARRHGLRVRTVDLRNSGDTAGSREQVVGYGAFVFAEE
ncbi:MAG: AmmeMemoRadiSam system protein B [Verrucomicrobia bacterium]|nr:AmmeMemoRadiSam system protein B [Verrucomicrobiota bacterium]